MEDDSLFNKVMRKDWEAVGDEYRRNGEIHGKKITSSEDTAIHVAVSLGQTEIVKKMLISIGETEAFRILSIKNERGNTPLHLAAALGNVTLCYHIARKDPKLLAVKNKDDATPLFLSVLYGKGEAFFCLDFLLKQSRETVPNDEYSLFKRKYGNTILHAAIFREHFGLAIQIIESYEDLVNIENEVGASPLHVLANKRRAFPSGSLLNPLEWRIISSSYIKVDKLVMKELKRPEFNPRLLEAEDESSGNHPETNRNRFRDEENLQQEGTFYPGCGNRVNIFGNCVTVFCAAIAWILYGVLVSVNKFIKIVTIGWLDFKHLILTGLQRRDALIETKTRWVLASVLLNKLVHHSSMYKYHPPIIPENPENQALDHQPNESTTGGKKMDTPILAAARIGVAEVVDKILNAFPVAAFDLDSEQKNVALLAAEHKRFAVYNLVLQKESSIKDLILFPLDSEGNSVLHLAAKFFDHPRHTYRDSATRLRVEYKWYQFVKQSMPPRFFTLHNRIGMTPDAIFQDTHKKLVKKGSEWLVKASESCSVVAALIATVAFATSASIIPADKIDSAKLGGVSLFDLYSISALLALCFSVISLVYFLAIRTSGFKVEDFGTSLPMKLFGGITSLFASLVCILGSFCFRHYLMLNDDTTRHIAIPIYIYTAAIVLVLAASQLPFYHGLLSIQF